MFGTKNHPLVGKVVLNQDGKELGEVTEVIVSAGLVWIGAMDITFPINAVTVKEE